MTGDREAMEAAYDAEIERCAGEYPRLRKEGLRLIEAGWLAHARHERGRGMCVYCSEWGTAGECCQCEGAKAARHEGEPSGCTPCTDCGADYAATSGAWRVDDAIWQAVVGPDPAIVLCPICFAKRAAAQHKGAEGIAIALLARTVPHLPDHMRRPVQKFLARHERGEDDVS